MASAAPLKDIDEKFLQCQICLNRLKEPKILSCLHRFCKDCLRGTVKRGARKIKCPMCRGKHDLPKGGVDALKTDYNTKNIVEFIELQSSVEHEPLKVCIHCSKKKVVSGFCFRCNDFLCQSCHEHHMTNPVLTDHRPHIFPLDEAEARNLTTEKLSSLKQAPRCTNHPEKLSELCCTTCSNLPICIACTYGAHRGHDLQEVVALAAIERAGLTEKVAALNQHREMIYKGQEEIKNTRDKLKGTVDEKRRELQEQLDGEERKLKEAISSVDERMKQKQKELDEKLERTTSAKKQEMEQRLRHAREEYERVCQDERREVDAELTKLQKESVREKKELQWGLDNINKGIKDILTSLSAQEEENTKKINELSDNFNDIMIRFDNVNAIASSILAAKNHWTDVQCIPDVCEAVDHLIGEMMKQSPGLETLSNIAVRGLSLVTTGRGLRVNINEREESVVGVRGVEFITGITGSENGSIIITGLAQGKTCISVNNMRGDQLQQYSINDTSQFCYCDGLSQFKVITVHKPNGIGVYDTRDGTYTGSEISDIISSWLAGRRVSCVAVDPEHSHIYVGDLLSGDVYVFSDQLQYIRTLVLPKMIAWPRDMTVHGGKLLVCDRNGEKAYAVTMEGHEARVVYEFTTPNHDGADWSPWSVCTDRNNHIYMLWESRSGKILTQYTGDGGQILTTMKVDENAECITTLHTDEGEKLLVATYTTQKLYTYGLIEEYLI